MKITPGTVIRDNKDKSEWAVSQIDYMNVLCTDGRFSINVRLIRIHTDGKPRKSGFSVVTWGPQG